MFYTTSRYASLATKTYTEKLAKKKNSKYINRGKKTIDDLASLIKNDSIAVVYEKKNKPFEIRYLKIDSKGNWEWTNVERIN